MKDSRKRNSRTNVRNDDRDMNEPTHTTQRGITSPKFGAAGSGGAENEPVTEVDRSSDNTSDDRSDR